MSFLKPLVAAAILALLPSLVSAATAPAAEAAPAFTEAQKAAIENIVRDLLVKKDPEIVMMAAQSLQRKMEEEQLTKGQEAVGKNKDKLFNDENSPVSGNPKGDVTVIEFFDYSCGYCKVAQDVVAKLLAEDKNVRFVYKEFPILGDGSVVASKAALASVAQGKYAKLHEALLSTKEHMSEQVVMKIAKDVGLDTDKLKKDMADPKIEAIIKANHDLADQLGARGTPTFVVGEQLFPGAIPLEQFKSAIDDARKAKKK